MGVMQVLRLATLDPIIDDVGNTRVHLTTIAISSQQVLFRVGKSSHDQQSFRVATVPSILPKPLWGELWKL